MHFRSDEKLRNVKKWDRTESWTPTRFPCRCQLYCCSCCNLHGLSSSPCLFWTCKAFQLKMIPLHTQGLCWALESRIGIFPSAACTGHPAYQFCVHTGDNEKNFRKMISWKWESSIGKLSSKRILDQWRGGGASTGSARKNDKTKTVFVDGWELAPDSVSEGWNWPY